MSYSLMAPLRRSLHRRNGELEHRERDKDPVVDRLIVRECLLYYAPDEFPWR
jgi:hypothetical protein